jgi:hypothetical protein
VLKIPIPFLVSLSSVHLVSTVLRINSVAGIVPVVTSLLVSLLSLMVMLRYCTVIIYFLHHNLLSIFTLNPVPY